MILKIYFWNKFQVFLGPSYKTTPDLPTLENIFEYQKYCGGGGFLGL